MATTIADYLALREKISAWRKADDEAPVKLRLSTGGTLTLETTVPERRSDCPSGRPCGHVRCVWHLWALMPEDRPGAQRDRIPATLRPAWLETPLPPSCAIDVALELGKRDDSEGRVEQASKALGVRSSRFRAILATALAKLKANREMRAIEDADDSDMLIERPR